MDSVRFRSLTPHPDKLGDLSLLDPLAMIDEEDRSVNKQLILIHKQYDRLKTANRQKQIIIQKLVKDVEAAKRSTSTINQDRLNLDLRLQTLETQLQTVINKRKEEEKYMKSYQYLLDRIKEDKTFLDEELRIKQEDLTQKKYILNTERKKAKKIKEESLKDKVEIKNLHDEIEKEKKSQESSLILIERRALERSKAILLLEESNKKRELIADAAQGAITNYEIIELRQKIQLHQFWYMFLNKKLQLELEKGGIFEEPFQRIKSTTGMQTVEEILTRFLTREEAYKDLILAVKSSETNLQDLKFKLNESNKKLLKIKIQQSQPTEDIQDDLIRLEKRSYINLKEISIKYKSLLQNIVEWAKKHLVSMKADEQSLSVDELIQKFCEETEKLIINVTQKAKINSKFLDDVLYMSTVELLKKNSFVKYFDNNCRIQPRKASNADEDGVLLIGN